MFVYARCELMNLNKDVIVLWYAGKLVDELLKLLVEIFYIFGNDRS